MTKKLTKKEIKKRMDIYDMKKTSHKTIRMSEELVQKVQALKEKERRRSFGEMVCIILEDRINLEGKK